MKEPTDEERRQGVRRLRLLLPAALAKLRHTPPAKVWTQLMAAQARYVTRDNFQALMVTPGAKGGWDVDLQLRFVPPGVANTIGSPVENPYPTREAAEAAAGGYLLFALALERDVIAGTTPVASPTFLFYGASIWLQEALMDRLKSICPNGPPPDWTVEHFRGEIEAFVAEHFPAGVSKDTMDALPQASMARLMSLLHMAAFIGVLVHPPREPGSPNPHRDASQTRH